MNPQNSGSLDYWAGFGVLLAPDVIEVWRSSRIPDSHGWNQTTSQDYPAELVGTFAGNLQESTPTSGPSSVADPYAAEGGGRGPASPSVRRLGKAFLPVVASVVAGDTLRAYRPQTPGELRREQLPSVWRVTSVSYSQGALGGMECHVAAVIECPAWDAPPLPPLPSDNSAIPAKPAIPSPADPFGGA